MTELPLGADFSSGDSTSSPTTKSMDGPVLRSDLRKLQNLLMNGDDSIARRKDIGEFHKRIVSLFTTLNQGLGEQSAIKAAEDRAQIDARLNAMEQAVNKMEGALRIELAPLMKAVVQDAVQARPVARPSTVWVKVIAALIAGVGVGYLLTVSEFISPSVAGFIFDFANLN